MSAVILDLASAKRPAPVLQQLVQSADGQVHSAHQQVAQTARKIFPQRFEFWRGASKERYVHTIYDLYDCPDLPQANYMLVRRDADGSCKILRIGQTTSAYGSENLAIVRHSAAQLGANEVHVHLLPEAGKDRDLVELDLRAGQFGTLAAEPVATMH